MRARGNSVIDGAMSESLRNLRGVTLRQLRTFHAVARLRSFTAAARELHITQPAVSMQVRELEELVGGALYERVGRRVHLTAAGEELAACAAGMLNLLGDTEARLAALTGQGGGVLKLGAISTAAYFAPALVAAFRARQPALALQFKVGNREDIQRRLADNEFDLAIMGRPPAGVATVATRFADHPLVVVAAPDHPLAGEARVPFARLAGEHFLVREPGSGTRAALEEVFAAHGLALASSLEMSSDETLKQAVMAGLGLAFISRHAIGLELATGRLAQLAVDGLPLLRAWYVVHLAAKRLTPLAAGFRDFLLTEGPVALDAAVNRGA